MKMTTDHSSARTLTSLFSWWVSGFTISGIDFQRPLANRLLHPRLVNGNDGLSFQLSDECPQPEAADADQRGEIHPRIRERVAVPRRRHQPVDGHVAHDDADHRDHADGLR